MNLTIEFLDVKIHLDVSMKNPVINFELSTQILFHFAYVNCLLTTLAN